MSLPRYRIRYSKEGAAKYISHLDMLRTFERVVRRAGLPVSYSQGFNPHPRFSFGMPLSVGMSGLAEYVDIDLDTAVAPEEVAASLDRAMPPGMRVSGARPVEEGSPSLMASTERSAYVMRAGRECLPAGPGVLNACLEDLLRSEEVNVSRRKKDGREAVFNIRPGLLSLAAREEDGAVVLEMEIVTASSFNVRPLEVVAAIGQRCGGFGEDCHLDITRVSVKGRQGAGLF
jgi:radical SAM-linked protein